VIRHAASRRWTYLSAAAALLVAVAVARSFVARDDDLLSPTDAALFLSGDVTRDAAAAARFGADRGLEAARLQARTTYRRLWTAQAGPLVRWAATQSFDGRLAPDTIFYPFGGPDAAFPLALFPSAREYILVGLERVLDTSGHDPLRAADAHALIGELPASLADFSGKGFFVTQKMVKAHHEGRFPGVLAIVLATLGSAGADVHAVEYVCVGPADALETVGRTTVIATQTTRPCGVRIRFHMPRTADEKTLLYLALSLGDESLTVHPVLQTLLSTRPYVVFCKAAQYFMHGAHGGSFETVTRLSLGGTAILQDDTCVPLRAFDRDQWELSFFGTYELFHLYENMLQPELARIYADRNLVRPVPQVAGYGQHTNLMLGVRRQGR
jgi:hypothetical protein